MSNLPYISSLGLGILAAQIVFFALIILLGLYQVSSTAKLRRALAESLRLSQDMINENSGVFTLATGCRSRYRTAAERIESVDALSIVISELARYPLLKLGALKITILQTDELLQGSPGFLVTLGLIGTFSGLIQNLSGLSSLLLTGNEAMGGPSLIQGFASLFPVMGAAFITSLTGIFLASLLWLVGSINGMNRLREELSDLLSGYLEQVVQADCRCYSLVGESVERMQVYLDDYLSKFSQTVGRQIEYSIDQSIKKLVDSLNEQVHQTRRFVESIQQGCIGLERAGKLFSQATFKLEKSSFASDFSDACSDFIEHSNLLAKASISLKDASSDFRNQSEQLASQINRTSTVQKELGSLISTSTQALKVSSELTEKNSDRINDAVTSMEGVNKRGMTWLSMRARTDTRLVDINNQLEQILAKFSGIAEKISSTTYTDLTALRSDMLELKSISAALVEGARNNEQALKSVQEGLSKMANPPSDLAA